ncbi:cytochrome-c oxidase, cbb3-type subunit III [Spongorhabdus nitratireducens]
MSSFWSGWIIVLTLTCLGLVTYLLYSTVKSQRKELTDETTGHAFDGIEEYDNPMPQWWTWMFVLTLLFAVVYFFLYPGLGSWKGYLGWTSAGELEAAQAKHDRKYGEQFRSLAAKSVDELLENPKALAMGERVFTNNCAICHASDARGSFGFPNLRDGDWLYGGEFDTIKATLLHGRQGQMPAWGPVLGEKGVAQVSAFVRNMSGIDTGASAADLEAGKGLYQTTCSVCHAADGSGNKALGAPNLTDNTWLYGSSKAQVEYTVRNGRNGVMPPWEAILGEEKVHLVSAYIYSISRGKGTPADAAAEK